MTNLINCTIAHLRLFTIYYLLFTVLCMPAFALELDTSVDEEIRKNYNPSKIEQDMALPPLPKTLNQIEEKDFSYPVKNTKPQQPPTIQTKRQTSPPATYQNKPYQTTSPQAYAVLKKGTKFKGKLITSISDRSRKGLNVKLISRYPVSTTYFTVPSGTVFSGEMIDVHKPQLAGNGGLMVIRFNSMNIDGRTYPIDAYVNKVNFKKIFFNNIKGERKYRKGLVSAAKPGCSFFGKMIRVSGNLASEGSGIILVPFSLFIGFVAFGANVIAAPAVAVFTRGGSVYIHEGSEFEIKLAQDVYIYK